MCVSAIVFASMCVNYVKMFKAGNSIYSIDNPINVNTIICLPINLVSGINNELLASPMFRKMRKNYWLIK